MLNAKNLCYFESGLEGCKGVKMLSKQGAGGYPPLENLIIIELNGNNLY